MRLGFSFVSKHERDIVLEIAPFRVFSLHTFIVETKVVSDDVFDALGVRALQAQVKESSLLS